jgi:hypothetical protein
MRIVNNEGEKRKGGEMMRGHINGLSCSSGSTFSKIKSSGLKLRAFPTIIFF